MTRVEFVNYIVRMINKDIVTHHHHNSLDEWFQLLDQYKYDQSYKEYQKRTR